MFKNLSVCYVTDDQSRWIRHLLTPLCGGKFNDRWLFARRSNKSETVTCKQCSLHIHKHILDRGNLVNSSCFTNQINSYCLNHYFTCLRLEGHVVRTMKWCVGCQISFNFGTTFSPIRFPVHNTDVIKPNLLTTCDQAVLKG